MKEKTLVALAAVCSVVGVVVLCLSSAAAKPKQVELSTVSGETGRVVEVYGTVGELRFSGEHAFVKLVGENGEWVEVPLFSRVRSGVGEFEVGDRMRVRGKAGTYKDKPQVVPSSASDVKIYRIHPVRFDQLGTYLNQYVKIEGTVRSAYQTASQKCLILTLENSGTAKAFLPFVPQAELQGLRVRACGLVQEYKGELEVALTCEAGLRIMDA
jgi:DNA/RNA endonuclease YhcR with UshA esterase domain